MQNSLAMLDADISDSELVEKILQMFSDIPTTTQVIVKLKALRQEENESILAYNQRYRILVERVEGQTIEQITSPVDMEMYLGTIIPPIRKSIKKQFVLEQQACTSYGRRSYVQGTTAVHETPLRHW